LCASIGTNAGEPMMSAHVLPVQYEEPSKHATEPVPGHFAQCQALSLTKADSSIERYEARHYQYLRIAIHRQSFRFATLAAQYQHFSETAQPRSATLHWIPARQMQLARSHPLAPLGASGLGVILHPISQEKASPNYWCCHPLPP